MKVLIVANAFPKFSETFIRDHIVSLIKNNIDVFVLVNEIDTPESDALKGFEDYNLISKTTTINKLLPNSFFSKIIKALSLVISVRANRPKLSLKSFISSCFKRGVKRSIHDVFILNFMASNDIDTVHAHYGNNGERMAFVSQHGIKLFTTFHGYDIRLAQKHGGHIYKELLESNSIVFAISNYNRQSLLDIGCNQSKIVDLTNGTDTEFFKRQESIVDTGKLKLITIARLSPEKGLDIALKSIKKILDDGLGLDIEYTIIGEGKSRMDLELLIEQLKLENIVKLVGAKSSFETRNELIKSDLFLLPSLAEALPTVVLEAQSAELPILATRVGSVESMVKGGIVVKPNSVKAFHEGLRELIQNRENWREMGKLGRIHVLENHSTNKQTKKLIEFYKTA